MTTQILHQALRTPDWFAIKVMPPESAAEALRGILKSLGTVEKQVFAMRGRCALLIEEGQLYRFIIDDEVGDYYTSMDRFLKQEFPGSWGYIRDALRTVKELKDMRFEDLLDIKRANIEQLKRVSSGVRMLPDVVSAAKCLPEKEFVSKLNKEHDQHLDVKAPIAMATPDECAEFEAAIARSMELGATTRSEAIRDISVNYLLDHPASEEQTA